MRQVLRRKHYSYRTEQVYLAWVKRFIFFHHKRHSREMNTPEIEVFLTQLAQENVSASTQKTKRSPATGTPFSKSTSSIEPPQTHPSAEPAS